jgi:DNA-binding SARP family transcriptional activator
MGMLRVFLFGKFHVQRGEQTLAGFEARKVQELFCYLLLNRTRSLSRETLADSLWSEGGTQAKNYLRKTLWQLQSALNTLATPTTPNNSHVLLIESEWIAFNQAAELWFDVLLFEQAFALVQDVPGRQLVASSAQVLKTAEELYRGELLEGWYSDWCLYERERLQHMYLAMLDKLMEYSEAHQEYETGQTYGMRALRYDRARERTHRRMMRLQYLAGDRTAALYQYERCAAALQEELGVQPAQSTVVLYEKIRADQLDDLEPLGRDHPQAVVTPLSEVLPRLLQLQLTLADAQRQVQEEIQAVTLAMQSQR